MKPFWIFTVTFLLLGVFSANAQDLLIMKDGIIIESRVVEVSQTEIRYKRFDHLEGPTIVHPAANVLVIRYENGRNEIINAASAGRNVQTNTQKDTAIDTDKFIFGTNANPGGFISSALGGGGGPSVSFELGKGNFNTEINLMFPTGGFGVLATFNGFIHSSIGGFYIGGGIGFGSYEDYDYETRISIPIGLNIGYKFVLSSGLYFRTGIFAGFNFGSFTIYLKPDLAIGWTMR